MIAILDYGIGNIRSLQNAFLHIGEETSFISNSDEILSADALIIPGVGAFKHGMQNISEKKLADVIHNFAKSGKPILGICLGYQILAIDSDEFGYTKGLGLLPANVKKLEVEGVLPHMGWNSLELEAIDPELESLLKDIESREFYFVHSYGVFSHDLKVSSSTTSYGGSNFKSMMKHNNILGVQFHPEKSGESGLAFLRNFIKTVKKT